MIGSLWILAVFAELASADLRCDMETIFFKYVELNGERTNVFRAKRNLEARKKWIADYIKV